MWVLDALAVLPKCNFVLNKLPKTPSRKLKTLTCCVCQCNQNAKSAIRRDFKMSLNATGYVTVPGERLKYRTLPCDIIAAYSLTPAFSFRMKLTIHVIDAHFGWDETNNAADSRREWLIAIVDSRRFPAACNAIAINASASNDPISYY